MTRREIIFQVLADASGRTVDQVDDLFAAMVAGDLISRNGLNDEISDSHARKLLGDFREELPGIRRWLAEEGLIESFGQA